MQALDKNKLLPFLYELSGLGYSIDEAIEKVETYPAVQAFTTKNVISMLEKMNEGIKAIPETILFTDDDHEKAYRDAIHDANEYIQKGIDTLKGEENEKI